MDSFIAANIRQRPLRTGVSVVGVALGVVLVVLFVGLAKGLQRDFAERQSNVDSDLRFFPPGNFTTSTSSLNLSVRYSDAIKNGVQPTPENPDILPQAPIAGVTGVTPVGEWIVSGGGIGFGLIDGIDYPSFSELTSVKIIDGQPLSDGLSPDTAYTAIVDRYYAEHNKSVDGQPVQVGRKILVLGHTFTVVGVYEPSVLARIKIPLPTLQDLLGQKDKCTYLMIKTETSAIAPQVKEAIKRTYPGNSVYLTSELPALYSQASGVFGPALKVFLNAVVGLAIVISTLVVLLAMYTTIIERTAEIGILKSLGASKGFIVMAIEKEAAVISALGVAAGFLISIAARYYIQNNTSLKIDFQLRWLVASAAIGLVAGIVGALYPALRAAALDPVKALSYD